MLYSCIHLPTSLRLLTRAHPDRRSSWKNNKVLKDMDVTAQWSFSSLRIKNPYMACRSFQSESGSCTSYMEQWHQFSHKHQGKCGHFRIFEDTSHIFSLELTTPFGNALFLLKLVLVPIRQCSNKASFRCELGKQVYVNACGFTRVASNCPRS